METKPEAPKNEITLNGEVYVRKDSIESRFVLQALYPVVMRKSYRKLIARCFALDPPRFVVDYPIMESETLFEHNFRWIGEPCNYLWEGAEENND